MAIRPTNASAPYSAGDQYYDSSKFVPELYSKKLLRNFYESTHFNETCNTDYEGEISGMGSKVWIRKTPEITVNDYAIGDTITYEVPTKDATELVIDQGVYSAFQVDDVNKAQADIDLINMFAKDAAERIKIKVDVETNAYFALQAAATNQGLTAGAISASVDLGLITGAGNSIDISTTNAVDYIVNLNQVLDEADIPSEGRWVKLPAWYCSMLKLGDLKRADVTADTTGVIRTGLLGEIDGTKVYRSNNLHSATDGDTKTSWYVQAGTNEACTFASQVDKVDTLKIPDSFGEYWRSLFVYGRSVPQPTALATLICKKG